MSIFKKFAKDQFNKYAGNKDFIEAVCAACALVAIADGTISDDELEAAVLGMQNNATLAAIYSGDEIEAELRKQTAKAKSISGKLQLKRELGDVGDRDIGLRQDVFAIAADVAAASGEIETKERVALNAVAGLLKVNGEQLLAA